MRTEPAARVRRAAASRRALALLLGLAAAACGEPGADPALPDLVLVTLDTTRADHLVPYGYPRPTSPRLAELAAESLVFERYVVPMATTLPSHVSLFTMTEPDEHGIVANLGYRFAASAELVPFAGYAASLGMQTAAFVSAAPLKRSSGIDAGFARFDEPAGEERRADETTDAALAWLAARPAEAPIFLWVHYFDPHSPYRPPPGFVERVAAPERVREELAARGVPELLPGPPGSAVSAAESATRYDAEIAFMDEQLGRLLGALRAGPRWGRSVVVVAGDHGESLGQHGVLAHGRVWHEQLRAPLLLRVPGEAPRRVGALLSAADVLPTLLALVPLPGAEAFLAAGSGRNALLGDPGERGVLSRSTEKWKLRSGEPVLRALTTPRWKYIRSDDGSEALYDLEADPHELQDVAARHRDVTDSLAARLARELAALRKRQGAAAGEPVDPTRLEELRALGYLDEEPGAEQEP
jgi:arylsulfatase A-like enzyme